MDWYIISLGPWFLYLIIRTLKALHYLKENAYNKDCRYFKYLISNPKVSFTLIDSIPLILIPLMIFFKSDLLMILFFLIYLGLFISLHNRISKEDSKKIFTVTPRNKRVIVTLAILYIIPFVSIFYCYGYGSCCHYSSYLIVLSYFQYFIVMLASKLNTPVEKLIELLKKRKKK